MDYTRSKNILQTQKKSVCLFYEQQWSKSKALYIKYCKILRKVIKYAKKQHCGSLMRKANNKIKTTFNIIKKETGNMHSVENLTCEWWKIEGSNKCGQCLQ